MPVYNAYFKIIKKNLPVLLIYVVVFITLAVFLAGNSAGTHDNTFSGTKIKLAFINHDTDSPLVDGLKNYLSKNATLVDIPDETKELQDALFYREVEYIITVPEGFTYSLLNDGEVQLEKSAVPGSSSEVFMDILINKYLNTARVYIDNIDNITLQELVVDIENDLNNKTDVIMNSSITDINNNEKRAYYFNYLAYALFAILILGVSSVMLIFNKSDLKRRNLCSPVTNRSMNMQLLLGHLSFALFAWFAMTVTSFFLYGSYMFSIKGALFLINSLLFTLAALSISFLIGTVIKGQSAMSAAANVVSLGTSFISGVMVPQEFISGPVLKIASFTPSYWYVKSNNIIADLVNFNMENLSPILINMLIVVGFAVAILSISLVIIKQKRVNS